MGIDHKNIAVLGVGQAGRALAARIARELEDARLAETGEGVRRAVARAWPRSRGLVCVMAAGIVVRAISGLVADKRRDPAVVVVDPAGRWAVSLLSGHLGGANELARRVAAITGGQPVITTASDCLGRTALDLWMAANDLVAAHPKNITRASARLVDRGGLAVWLDEGVDVELPADLAPVTDRGSAEIAITWRAAVPGDFLLLLHPPVLVLGVGCNRGTPVEEFEIALHELCTDYGLAAASIAAVATIDLKADEAGLVAFARRHGWPLRLFGAGELDAVAVPNPSAAARCATGAGSVAEAAALLAAPDGKLIVEKRKWQNVTMAVALAGSSSSAPAPATWTT